VDVFDPRTGGKDVVSGKSSTRDSDWGRVANNGNGSRGRQKSGAERPGETKTSYLERLVESYLEAKASLAPEEFQALTVRVAGKGEVRLVDYFRPIGGTDLMDGERVLYGGGTLIKRYGDGFKIKFFDKIGGHHVFLYVSQETMNEYRYRKYLLEIVRQAPEVRYLKVFALAKWQLDEERGTVSLAVGDLRHLAILLGPKKATPSGSDASSNSTSNVAAM
jgi:hypothetical protein